MSFLSPTWVEKAKEPPRRRPSRAASDIAVEAVEGLKAGQRPELVEIEGRTLVLVGQIGEGGYAFVHLARDLQSGARFMVADAREEEAARNAAPSRAAQSLDPRTSSAGGEQRAPLDGGRGDEYCSRSSTAPAAPSPSTWCRAWRAGGRGRCARRSCWRSSSTRARRSPTALAQAAGRPPRPQGGERA